MNVSFAVNDHCTISTDVDGVKTAFKLLTHLSEIFGQRECGNCKSPNLRPKYRTANRRDNGALCEYYSIQCDDCRHEFKFGQKQQEGQPLFPKGWEPPYQGDGNQQVAPQQQPEPTYQYGVPQGYQPPPPAPPARQPAPQSEAGDIPF